MHKINMFDRTGVLTTWFENSGADWLEQYKKIHWRRKHVVTSPHKIYPRIKRFGFTAKGNMVLIT
jgi:hypothetical protein